MHERMKRLKQRLGLKKSVRKSSTFDERLSQYAIPEHAPGHIINGGFSDYTLNTSTEYKGKLLYLYNNLYLH